VTVPMFVTVLSVVIGFVGALFFCVGSANLDRKSIGALAGTYWDENPHLANFLRVLKAEYLCGGIALYLTFVLQFVAAVPGLLPEGLAFEQPWFGAVVAVLVGAGSGGVLVWVRARLIAQLAATQPAESEPNAKAL
jgi:hypothetical protein